MNPLVQRGLMAHLGRFESALGDGAERLGWKVAFNVLAVQRRLGLEGSLVAGLTRTTLHEGSGVHSLAGATRPALEAEVAVWLGRDVAPGDSESRVAESIQSWAPAIELVDFNRSLDDLELVLGEGVFHRAVVFGEPVPTSPGAELAGRNVRVDYAGRVLCQVDAREATGHAPAVLLHLSRLLSPHGHGLRAGDVVILGSMNPFTTAEPGTTFSVAIDGLGNVSLSLGS